LIESERRRIALNRTMRNREARPRRFHFSGAWFALAVALAYVAWDSIAGSRHILETSSQYGVTVDAPAVDPRSATGYAQGRRSLLLPAGEADTAHWIMQTQSMIERGEWRIRHVDYDNAPRGREVHWAAPLHWWLAGLAWIDHFISGRPVGMAVERATLTAGPVMLVLLLVGLTPFLSRRFSPTAAALVAIGAVTVFPFYIDFVPARADHHGLVNICCLLTVLFLLAGSDLRSSAEEESGAEPARTRRWIIASALAGGVGLWISAATQVPILIAVGVGLLVASWIGRGSDRQPGWMREPGLLRLWGWTGGAVSFVTYLIEYFPSHFGIRLEVNHPFYALAWIGAGEVLRVAIPAITQGKRSLARRDLTRAGIGLGLIALLPAIILLTRAETFTVADPFVWRLHALYISEFQGLLRNFATKGFGWTSLGFCLPTLLLLPPLVLMLRKATPRETKAQIALAWIPAVLGWAMGWSQIRWLGLAYAVSVPVIAIVFQTLEAERGKLRSSVLFWTLGCGLLFLPGAVNAVQRTRASAESTPEEIRSLAERDVAHWLRLRAGSERVVIAGAPMSTTKLISLGGLDGLATLYWENAEGLKNAAQLFGAASPEAAQALVQRLGVTHIVLLSWDAFEVTLAKMDRALPESAPLPADLFVANLLKSPVPPPWLRAIPFKLPNHPSLVGAQVRIWEVVPTQSPAAAVAHAANYYLELGLPDIAAQFAPRLATERGDLTALVMLAGLASRQRDNATFSVALREVTAQLARADSLALDDHIHLVVVLAVGQQMELARAQLQACVRKIDERGLRHLTSGALSDLLALCDAFAVELPGPELKRLADQLVPPSKRK
jgi:hypothetical protein